MPRLQTLFLASALLSASVLPSLAWTPPGVGRACQGTRGDGPRVSAIAGNFLGGKLIRDGLVNRMSFQSCFTTLTDCERWLSDKAMRYPLAPGFARCTPVVLR